MGLFSIGYLFIAVVDFALLVWALGQYKKYPSTALWLAMTPLYLLWYDNVLIGLGSTLGEGDLLKGLNVVRFLGHYIMLPFVIIALGSLARQAGFAWAQLKVVMGAFCVLATYFMVSDLWLFYNATLYPSCFADTLRYTTHISEFTACGPDAEIGIGTRIAPIPAITLSNLTILLGAYMWWKIGYKWLFIGSVSALLFFAVPFGPTGGIVGNMGEPIITAVTLFACIHVTRTFGSSKMPKGTAPA